MKRGLTPILINSHVTPLSLYGTHVPAPGRADHLFRRRGQHVLVDGPPGPAAKCPLGFAPDRDLRVEPVALGLPPSFEFTSRCIFAANVIPSKNDAFKAVLSRCDIYELSATNEEVLEFMRCVSANGFHGLTPDDCSMVIDFIAENSEDRQLSMRLGHVHGHRVRRKSASRTTT